MLIQLTDKIRVNSNSLNYIIERKFFRKKSGEPYWSDKRKGYYPNWDCLIEDLLQMKIQESDCKKLSDISKLLKTIKEEILENVEKFKR